MTSIRQTKKNRKKLVAKVVIMDEQRKRHYSRMYKHFHAAVKKLLSDITTMTTSLHGATFDPHYYE